MGKFALKALNGPVKGRIFPVRHGLRIGRSSGDVILKDSSVSDPHAEIQIDSQGKIIILDQGSKNKIIMDRQRFDQLALEKGDEFQIGRTKFVLESIKTPEEVMSRFIQKAGKNITDQPVGLEPFFQDVEIAFVSGPQKGQRHYLSYGPRYAGAHSADLPIFEKKAPEKAFVLAPDGEKALFMTEHPSLVRLNRKKAEKAEIKDGDEIFIGGAVLKISLKK